MKLTFEYGRSPSQTGDLYVPEMPARGVICLLHGGFWKLPYGREQLTSMAQDLVRRGYAVWNIGYRRIGEPGGGWPGSFDDVYAGVDYLQQISTQFRPLDLTRIILVGHSAGGHLALWRAAQSRFKRRNASRCLLDISGVAALAPLADLKAAHRDQIGGDSVERLLGGAPPESAPLWAAASPAQMLPVGVPQLLLHGEWDETVPVAHSVRYAEAATTAGDCVELLSLPDTGHMDFLNPGTIAHAALCSWLDDFRLIAPTKEWLGPDSTLRPLQWAESKFPNRPVVATSGHWTPSDWRRTVTAGFVIESPNSDVSPRGD